MQDYQAIRAQIREQMEAARKLARGVFEKGAGELLSTYGIDSFAWTQYTPYFNDGDACVFRVNADTYDMDINGDTEDPDGDYRYESMYRFSPGSVADDLKAGTIDQAEALRRNKLWTAAEAAFAFVNSFDEDDMLHMFGDHARVIVRKNGIEVEDYNHD